MKPDNCNLSNEAILNDSFGQPSVFSMRNLSNNIEPGEDEDFASNDSFLKMSSQLTPSQGELEAEGEDQDSNSENRDKMMDEGHDLNQTNLSSDQYIKNKLHLSLSKLKREPIITTKNLGSILSHQ